MTNARDFTTINCKFDTYKELVKLVSFGESIDDVIRMLLKLPHRKNENDNNKESLNKRRKRANNRKDKLERDWPTTSV